MKVFMKVSFFIAALFAVTFSSAYAQESKSRSNDGWFLVGYSYTFPDTQQNGSIGGPVTLTAGGDIWRFIGLEVTLGGRWSINESSIYANNQYLASYKEALWSFDIKPYLMLQPKIGVDLISLRPYFGIGPSFHFTGLNSTLDLIGQSTTSTSSFDVGFSAKAGLRLQALKLLFVGVGTEYLYHKAKLNNINYDLSGWTVGAEIGFIW